MFLNFSSLINNLFNSWTVIKKAKQQKQIQCETNNLLKSRTYVCMYAVLNTRNQIKNILD